MKRPSTDRCEICGKQFLPPGHEVTTKYCVSFHEEEGTTEFNEIAKQAQRKSLDKHGFIKYAEVYEAIAVHARTTDPVKKKLEKALTEANGLNVNWSCEADPEDLLHYSEYKSVIRQGREALDAAKAERLRL